MTRLELLTLIVRRARTNGFEFRRWYTTRLNLPWISEEAAVALLDTQRRYYALLFSHEFALAFWHPDSEITFQVPAQTFQRTMPDGTTSTVTRKPYTRRSNKKNAWRYHLREMAVSEEPLRHIRKFLNVEDELAEPTDGPPPPPVKTAKQLRMERTINPPGRPPKPITRPLPTGTPTFLSKKRYPY